MTKYDESETGSKTGSKTGSRTRSRTRSRTGSRTSLRLVLGLASRISYLRYTCFKAVLLTSRNLRLDGPRIG